jgi:hypothetical protein
MTGFDLNSWLEWASPRDTIYTGVGDASVMPEAALYGIVLVPTASARDLEKSIEQVKLRFGSAIDATIHCREIFNGAARAKGPWAHLTQDTAISLLRDSFLAANSYGVRYLVAFSPKAYFPRRLRLLGRNGHADLVHDIDKNWITLNLFQGLAGYLDPVTVSSPPDYLSSPRPLTEPFWQLIVRRKFPGLLVDRLYVDREQTKIRWFSKSFQWATVARDLVIEGPRGQSYLPIISPGKEKHPLLQLADMFVYALGRELTGRQLQFGQAISNDVFLEIVGEESYEIVRGLPDDVAAYKMKKARAPSLSDF